MKSFLGDQRALRDQAAFIVRQRAAFHRRDHRRSVGYFSRRSNSRKADAPVTGDRIRERTEQELELAKKMSSQEVEAASQKVQAGFFKHLVRYLSRLDRDFVLAVLESYYVLIDPEVPVSVKAGFAVILLYFINPLDLIPDFIPVFGFVDDVGVFGAAFLYLGVFVTPKHVKQAEDWLDKD